MDHIDFAMINRLSQRLPMFKQKAHGKYNFRCPICGDSQKNKYKARGWIIDFKGSLRYHCFNDDSCGSSFSYFLKRFDENLATDYRFEKFKEYGYQKREEEIKPQINTLEFEDDEPEEAEKVHFKGLPKISELDSSHPARKYLEDRLLPKRFFDELYFCDHWKALTNEYEQTYDKIEEDEHRIVIPAYNRQGELICFQGRIVDDGSGRVEARKYMTVKVKDELKIYGAERIKKGSPVFILEGAFDTMFLSNSIAMLGGSLNSLDGLPDGYEYVFVLDNEPRNVSVLRRYKQTIEKGYSIVSWLEWPYKQKDINLCVQAGVDPSRIQKYLEQNITKGLMASLKLESWKKQK